MALIGAFLIRVNQCDQCYPWPGFRVLCKAKPDSFSPTGCDRMKIILHIKTDSLSLTCLAECWLPIADFSYPTALHELSSYPE